MAKSSMRMMLGYSRSFSTMHVSLYAQYTPKLAKFTCHPHARGEGSTSVNGVVRVEL